MKPGKALRVIKLVHTGAWGVFVGCIVGMPVLAYRGRFGAAAVAGGVVLGESLARYNKEIFGSLYAAGLVYSLSLWAGWL